MLDVLPGKRPSIDSAPIDARHVSACRASSAGAPGRGGGFRWSRRGTAGSRRPGRRQQGPTRVMAKWIAAIAVTTAPTITGACCCTRAPKISVATAPSSSSTSRRSPASVASTMPMVGTNAASSAGPYAAQLLRSRPLAQLEQADQQGQRRERQRVRLGQRPRRPASMSSHQATISKPTAAQNRVRRCAVAAARAGRGEAEHGAPGGQQARPGAPGESKASARAISAAPYPLHSTVAASRAASGRRSRGSAAATTSSAAPTASTPNADQAGGSPATSADGEHEELAPSRRRTASRGCGRAGCGRPARRPGRRRPRCPA